MDTPRLVDLIDLLFSGREVFFRYVRTTADVMTTDVRTLTLDHSLADARELLERARIHHVPIVDEPGDGQQPILVGIVSDRDLARHLSPAVGSAAQTDADDRALARRLSSIVTRELRAVGPDTGFLDAVRILVEHRIDCVPVAVGKAHERRLVGLLTASDVLRSFLRLELLRRARREEARPTRLIDLAADGAQSQPAELLVETLMGRVEDVMASELVTIEADAPLKRALDLMRRHTIRHLPVVERDGRLAGVLSDRDALAHLPPPASGRAPRRRGDETFRGELFRVELGARTSVEALSQPVRRAMTPSPRTVRRDTPIFDAAELLCAGRVDCAPVVDADGSLVGVVTRTDFLRAILALGHVVPGARAA